MISRILLTTLFFLSTFVFGATFEKSPIESKTFIHSYVQKVGGELIQDNTRITDLVNAGAESKSIKEKTWIIPNKVGTGFEVVVGFKAIPINLHYFDLEITYPEMTLPSGEKRSQINRQIDIAGHDSKFVWPFTYYFDFPYETTPGDWDIKIRSNGDLIYSSTFTIVEH
jgi:uncharacterized protein DUF3859